MASRPNRPQVQTFPLIGLPNEIICKVFVLSQNLSLALVNRHLHKLLFDTTTLRDFCIFAFTPSGALQYPSGQTQPSTPIDPRLVHQTKLLEAPWFDSAFALAVQSHIPRLDAAAKCHDEMRLKGELTEDTRPWATIYKDDILAAHCVTMPKRVMCLPWTEEKDAMFRILRSWGVELWPRQKRIEDIDMLDGLIKAMAAQDKMYHAEVVRNFKHTWRLQFHPFEFMA